MDGFWILGGLWFAVSFHAVPWGYRYGMAAAMAIVVFNLMAEHKHLYRSWRGDSFRHESAQVLWIWLYVMTSLLLLGFTLKVSHDYSRLAVLTWFAAAPAVLLVWRLLVRWLLHVARARGRNSRTAVVVGAGDLGARFAVTLSKASWLGIRLNGFYDDDKPKSSYPVAGKPWQVKGDLAELVKKAHQGDGVDIIYLALPKRADEQVQRLVAQLADTTASVYLLPDIFVSDLLHARWLSFGGVPAVSVYETPFAGVRGWAKRLEDIVLSVLILILIALPMLLIALGVKLSSPGPVLFKQRRYGLHGEVVQVWKFRTMKVCEDGEVVRQAKKGDERVTRFGVFLRRASLDELPQFFNVLQGHMSIVGPRPHAVAHNEEYRQLIHGYMLRHKVKPGITGWAQVNGWRGETDTLEKMEKRVQYDLDYIRRWSLALDFKIIGLTVLTAMGGKNAY
jgi:putative colanic acid biosynthesis UDP-glucose lipid carrier transferase